MKILLVGSGKLAKAILQSNLSIPSCEMLAWESAFQYSNEKAIIVHAGSGRQLQDCFAFCQRTGSVFVELSTGLETEKMHPQFPLIICPNTSILLLKTLAMIKAQGSSFVNYDISIAESHQSSKTTEPGTAYAFAQSLQVPNDSIVSVRDPEFQEQSIGIPKEYLNKHAYHKIVISDGNDQVTIETKVLGHDSYAKGVKAIVEAVIQNQFENKNYSIFNLIEAKML
jgi:dihydrodipicolinate reductase